MAKAIIIDNSYNRLGKIKDTNYPIAKIKDSGKLLSEIRQTIPFRVKFTTIGVEGYGPNNPAPIGIAVIGFNNYIL